MGHPAQPPAQAGSPRAGCTALRPGRSGISPEKETPQPPWAAWARAPSPSEGRSTDFSPFYCRKSRFSRCPPRPGLPRITPGQRGAAPRPGPFPPGRGVPGGTLCATDPWRRGGPAVSSTISLPPSLRSPLAPRNPPRCPRGLSRGSRWAGRRRREGWLCAGAPRASPRPSGCPCRSLSPVEAQPRPRSPFPGLGYAVCGSGGEPWA